jgi:hypothetical protein
VKLQVEAPLEELRASRWLQLFESFTSLKPNLKLGRKPHLKP